jgi:hypothetical protein
MRDPFHILQSCRTVPNARSCPESPGFRRRLTRKHASHPAQSSLRRRPPRHQPICQPLAAERRTPRLRPSPRLRTRSQSLDAGRPCADEHSRPSRARVRRGLAREKAESVRSTKAVVAELPKTDTARATGLPKTDTAHPPTPLAPPDFRRPTPLTPHDPAPLLAPVRCARGGALLRDGSGHDSRQEDCG